MLLSTAHVRVQFFFSTPFIGSYKGAHHVGGIEGSTNSLRSLVYLTVPTKY